MNDSDSISLSDKNKESSRSFSKYFLGALSALILVILLGTISSGTSEQVHAQLLKLGPYLWDDYFVLRGARPDVSCDPNPDIDARLNELAIEHEQDNADFDLFETEFDREAAKASLLRQVEVCQKKHDEAAIHDERYSVWVAAFIAVEHSFADISLFAIEKQKTILILLLVLAATVSTWRKSHIGFRSVHTKTDHYISYTASAIAHASLGVSTYSYYMGASQSGTEVAHPEIMILLALACAVLTVISVFHLLTPDEELEEGGDILRALLSIPIYVFMLLAAAYHFFIVERHFSGIAIYFTQIFQLTSLLLSVGLYILVGMLLKESMVGAKLFDVFKPWRLPPEMLAFFAIALMAYPTAYTGASGIIIIAMGAVVYQEMRRVGTRRQLALAVTAMTGSGIVLRPSLLIVGIAILNKEVVTDELYYWGFQVFLLGMVVFGFYAWLIRKEPAQVASFGEALAPSFKLLGPVIPYVLIVLGSLAAYGLLLNTFIDEYTAPLMLPVIVALFLIYERKFSSSFTERNKEMQVAPTVTSAFSKGVDNSAIQIGALLMLMACSSTIGGIIEHSGGGFAFPDLSGSVFAAMGLLLLFLILIGMVMDPFGALILVSVTIAPIAYAQGIHPVHFWMTCLMAFELGYLTPPVSLNHLLTRQVVGDKEVLLSLENKDDNFYYRHERIILPLLVMGTTLLLVAFGPLIYFEYFGK